MKSFLKRGLFAVAMIAAAMGSMSAATAADSPGQPSRIGAVAVYSDQGIAQSVAATTCHAVANVVSNAVPGVSWQKLQVSDATALGLRSMDPATRKQRMPGGDDGHLLKVSSMTGASADRGAVGRSSSCRTTA